MFLPKVIFRTLAFAMLVLALSSVIVEPDDQYSALNSQDNQIASTR